MSDAKADRKQYQITVNGNRFAIASPYGEEHIRKVESFLEQQISTIQQSSSSISSSNLYLLVALNLADQLMRQKQQPKYDEMEKNLRDLCERLDQVLV